MEGKANGGGIAIAIPARTYLKKFVHWSLNLPLHDRIDLGAHSKDMVVKMIGGVLTGKIDATAATSSNDPIPEDYFDDSLLVVVNHRRFQYNRLFINKNIAQYLDSLLYAEFHANLLTLIRVMTQQKLMNEADCIRYMMETMGLDEDEISFDALKKASYRLRKEKEIPNFR